MPAVRHPDPVPCVGAVLAGGEGRRLGGDKAGALVAGRPLLEHALGTVGRVARPVAVVVRSRTSLPMLPGPTPLVWTEPDGAQHPLSGVVHALREAKGQPVLVCAVDLPLLDAATLRVLLIAAALAPKAPAVVPRADGQLQVLCALYRPAALVGLEGFAADARATAVVDALGPAVVPFEDPTPFVNVNTPDDVVQAERLLAKRRL